MSVCAGVYVCVCLCVSACVLVCVCLSLRLCACVYASIYSCKSLKEFSTAGDWSSSECVRWDHGESPTTVVCENYSAFTFEKYRVREGNVQF